MSASSHLFRISGKALTSYPILAIVGVAFLQSSKWMMLNDGVGITIETLLFSRYIGLACFAALAVIFRNQAPAKRPVLVIAGCLMVLYLALLLVAPSLAGGAFAGAVASVAGISYGIADALFTFLFLQLFSSYAPKASALLLIVSQVLTNILMAVLGALPPIALYAARIGLILLGGIGLSWDVLRTECPDGNPDDAEARAEAHMDAYAEVERLDVFPASIGGWVLFLVAIAVFCGLFGLTAQVSSLSGGSFALYDTSTGIILVMMDLLLLIYLVFRGDRFTFEVAVVICGALYMFSFVAYSESWAGGSLIAGVVLRTGYDFLTVFAKVIILRKAFVEPDRVYLYVGLYWLFSTVYPGRSLGVMLVRNAADQAALVTSISQFATLAVFLVVLATLLLAGTARGKGAVAQVLGFDTGAAAPQDETRDELEASTEAAADSRAAELEAFGQSIGLSEREQAVFVEIVNGRTRGVIAERLYLSPDTVKTHTTHIYAKAKVRSKQELLDKLEAFR